MPKIDFFHRTCIDFYLEGQSKQTNASKITLRSQKSTPRGVSQWFVHPNKEALHLTCETAEKIRDPASGSNFRQKQEFYCLKPKNLRLSS